VIIGGATPRILKNRGSLQDIDQIAVMKSLVKWYTTIKSYKELSKVNEGFYRAQEGVPGPVFVEIPIDILWPLSMVNKLFGTGSKNLLNSNSLSGRLIKLYVDRYTRKTFKGASYFSIPTKIPVTRKIISDKILEKIVITIEESKKPLLLIGSQGVNDVNLIDSIIEAVERLHIPVYLSGMARGLLGKNHKLQFRHRRKDSLGESDLIILAGVPVDFRLDYGSVFNRKAKVISVNLDKKILKKNKRATFKSDTHPGQFLIDIGQSVISSKDNWTAWFDALRKREEERNNEIIALSKQKMERINPLRLCCELEKTLSDNTILIGDGGDFIATISYILQPRRPLSWLDPGPFGTLGVGAGFALAAKLVFPDKDVWILYGDGSVGYTIAEYDTFIRHKLPIIGLVGNDSGWMQVAREQMEVFNDSIGTELGDRSYERVVDGFGAKGLLLNDESTIESIIKQAVVVTNAGLPVLINAFIGRSKFRKGSISM
ncbi:MAG: thiamine pyrophosphate-binding protein, partial [Candidatus Heimdallarchaeota archaeon]